MDEYKKREFFSDAFDSYGRTALCLSGGAALVFGHFGVVKALFDLKMLPHIITGTSAGTLAAAIVGIPFLIKLLGAMKSCGMDTCLVQKLNQESKRCKTHGLPLLSKVNSLP
jgi:hypothetical protein